MLRALRVEGLMVAEYTDRCLEMTCCSALKGKES